MMAGRVLYRDVWDHKPPLIFLINLWALKIGDGTINSVRIAERIFIVAGAMLLFWMVHTLFGDRWLAFWAAVFLLIHIYYHDTFKCGNLTEEYGAIFLIAGICAAFASRRLNPRAGAVMAFVSGFVLSLATLTKEPFLLSALPWFVYVAWPHKGKYKLAFLRTALFVIGALVPVVVLAVWLLANGALSGWAEATLSSFTYASRTSGTWSLLELSKTVRAPYMQMARAMVITKIAALLGLLCLFSRSFVRKYQYMPWVIFATVLTSYIATSFGGRYYGHYYMQLVPSYVLFGMCGLAFVQELIGRVKIRFDAIMLLILLWAALFFIDSTNLKKFIQNLAEPAQRWEGSELTTLVLDNTKQTDTIWAASFPHTHLYLDTGRLSPTKWLAVFGEYFATTPYSTKEQKYALLQSDLEQNPPRLIIIGNAALRFFERENFALVKWLSSHYEVVIASDSKAPLASQVWIYAE